MHNAENTVRLAFCGRVEEEVQCRDHPKWKYLVRNAHWHDDEISVYIVVTLYVLVKY